MSDLEHSLPAQLSTLADELAPSPDLLGQAAAAKGRYRRRRRAHAGLAAVAVAVAVIAVGVPTALGSLSSAPPHRTATVPTTAPAGATEPDPAAAQAQAQAQAELLNQQAAAAAAAEKASAPPAPGGMSYSPEVQAHLAALTARATDELATAITRLSTPVRIAAPTSDACPDGAAALSQGLGTHIAYEQGDLTRGQDGCQWSTDGDAAMASEPEVRLTVGAGHSGRPIATTFAGMRQVVRTAQPGQCLQAPVVAVDPQAVLLACAGGSEIDWRLFLPDSAGSGTWVLSALVGEDVASPTGADALRQVAALATATWRG